MKRKYFLITLTLFSLLISSCGQASPTPTVPQTESFKAEQIETQTETVTEPPVAETETESPVISDTELPPDYVWDPHTENAFYESVYSTAHMEAANAAIDAICHYDETFTFDEKLEFWEVEEILPYLFPPYYLLVLKVECTDGTGKITYTYEKEESEMLLESFGRQIEWWINTAVRKNDSFAAAAISLYHLMSMEVSYDDAAANDDTGMADVSPYRSLMEKEGICQSFSSAYAYLLMKLGIEAVPAGGLTEDYSAAHEWTLLKLHDKWYYADVTFENGYGGEGLCFFGMTTAERYNQGTYKEDIINVGQCNRMWGSEIDVNDETYSELWYVYKVDELIHEENGGLSIRYHYGESDSDSESITIEP